MTWQTAVLRYDLTLPLSRYYANNAANLPSPFKALQMGSVWRADRPQKGRFRQFTQCDIDILGDPTNLAEIELILATTTASKQDLPGQCIYCKNQRQRHPFWHGTLLRFCRRELWTAF